MKYKIDWSEVTKTGEKDGRPWKMTKMTLRDEQNQVFEGVTTFDSVMTGHEIEGEIVMNGVYKNFKKSNGNRKPNFDRIIEKKANMINESMEKKDQNIRLAQDRSAWMWAKNNASTLIAARGLEGEDEETIADMVQSLATKIYNGEPTEPFN